MIGGFTSTIKSIDAGEPTFLRFECANRDEFITVMLAPEFTAAHYDQGAKKHEGSLKYLNPHCFPYFEQKLLIGFGAYVNVFLQQVRTAGNTLEMGLDALGLFMQVQVQQAIYKQYVAAHQPQTLIMREPKAAPAAARRNAATVSAANATAANALLQLQRVDTIDAVDILQRKLTAATLIAMKHHDKLSDFQAYVLKTYASYFDSLLASLQKGAGKKSPKSGKPVAKSSKKPPPPGKRPNQKRTAAPKNNVAPIK